MPMQRECGCLRGETCGECYPPRRGRSDVWTRNDPDLIPPGLIQPTAVLQYRDAQKVDERPHMTNEEAADILLGKSPQNLLLAKLDEIRDAILEGRVDTNVTRHPYPTGMTSYTFHVYDTTIWHREPIRHRDSEQG